MTNMTSRCLAAFLVVALLHVLGQIGVAAEQNNVSRMGLSSILYTNQTLVSPNGVFELGFYFLSGSTDFSNYTLAVWYTSPIRTSVWMADRNLKVSHFAYLQLSSDGRLVVSDPYFETSQVVWASTTQNLNVIGAYLLDTGNLVLLDNRNSTVWQSFDTPTNTLLPGQKYFSNASRKLQSWKTAEDWGEGRYICTWDNNNQFMFVWNMTNTGTYTDWPTNWKDYPQGYPIIRIPHTDYAYVDTLGGLNLVYSRTNVTTLILNSTGINDPALRRVTLDPDGGLRIYKWTLGQSSTWSVEADIVRDPCSDVYGVCGPYGICIPVTITHADMIICNCPEGYELIDPADRFQGCKPIVPLLSSQCSSIDSVEFASLVSIDYPVVDSAGGESLNFSTCTQKCGEGCQCNGFVYSYLLQKCWLKTGPLWNGRYHNASVGSGDRNSYLKVSALPQVTPAPAPAPAPTQPPLSLQQKRKSSKLLLAFASSLGFIFVLLIVFFSLVRRRKKLRQMALETKFETLRSSPVLKFTYSELKAATKNFREEIGKGAFGSVFKGEVGQAKYSVAVKRLEKLNTAGEKGLLSEVMTIGSIHHVNLVRLHGYCAEGTQRLLVYEYVELGSLDKFIFRRQQTSIILEWRIRFQIVVETARALMYLHEDCRKYRIIHRDIKPQNILLDKFFHVKLADFGLARLMNREHTRTMTSHGAGTLGYLAPECSFEHAPLTPKIDVFSYGMVVLEIIGGRRNFIYNFPQDPAGYFPAWAWEKMESGDYAEIVDPCLGADFDMIQVELLVQVAFWCINENPEARPSMALVHRMLQGLVHVDHPVPKPSYLLNWVRTANSTRNDE
ncbi:hypothetical protein O6H91_Y220700 [Diphasiastrum complanatum]|nr:hypothetical protein O6H91_Y220700 [Diphasiastrum complanatum]